MKKYYVFIPNSVYMPIPAFVLDIFFFIFVYCYDLFRKYLFPICLMFSLVSSVFCTFIYLLSSISIMFIGVLEYISW